MKRKRPHIPKQEHFLLTPSCLGSSSAWIPKEWKGKKVTILSGQDAIRHLQSVIAKRN